MVSDPTTFQRLSTTLKASRPQAWTFTPILFGIGVIHSQVLPTLEPSLLLQLFALSFPFCLSAFSAIYPVHFLVFDLIRYSVVFGVNDTYDYESDLRNPRKSAGGIEGGVLHPIYHKDILKAAYASTIFVLASALINQQPHNILAVSLNVLLAWQYSSPPFRLKEVPILDSLSNGCIIFLAWSSGFTFSGSSLSKAPGYAYKISLCSAGVHALGAVMDTEADIAGGYTTIAVTLGKRPAAIFGAACFLPAVMTLDAQSSFGIFAWVGLAIMLVPCINVRWAHRAFMAVALFSFFTGVYWLGSRAWCISRGLPVRLD